MNIGRETTHLTYFILFLFLLMIAAAAYWAIAGADSVLEREDNPRAFEAERRIQRGRILDKNGNILAYSAINENGLLQRYYTESAIYGLIGYYSLRYGVGGIEAAYDPLLRGDHLMDELWPRFERDVLHRPQSGSDVTLTIDLDIQQALHNAFGDYQGAAVILGVPDGNILAMLSQPGFDPNQLDSRWDELITAPGDPFFNRVQQGQYQPGSLMHTPLLAGAILAGYNLENLYIDADRTVTVGTVQAECIAPPPASTLSLIEAYAYGCPGPFLTLAETLGEDQFIQIISDFQMSNSVILDGFMPANSTSMEDRRNFEQEVLGQGTLTVNPLRIATMTAAIINGGNAPTPYLLQGSGDAELNKAIPQNNSPENTAMMTEATAEQLIRILIANAKQGPATSAYRPNMVIGGQSALAISGENTQAWFTGFVQLDNQRGAVIAIVIENNVDPTAAARVAAAAIEQTHSTLLKQ